MSLYQTVRPKSLDGIVGQPEAVTILRRALAAEDRPHSYLLCGPSGVGKTTAARVMARELGCEVDTEGGVDYLEQNASNNRGIDDIRHIIKDVRYPPIGGGNRVIVLDECAALTKDAQNCLLKPLEDYPPYQYYVLCTTEPQKVLKTIRTRCTYVPFKLLSEDDVFDLMVDVVKAHGLVDPGDAVLDAIARKAEGCPRSALTMLEQCLGLSEASALTAVSNYRTHERQSIDLCRLLIRGATWADIAMAYGGMEEKEPETVRRMLLGYLKSCLLKARKPAEAARIAGMVEELSRPTYDSGEALLLAEMWLASRVGKGE